MEVTLSQAAVAPAETPEGGSCDRWRPWRPFIRTVIAMSTTLSGGPLVAIEGIDGAGTTTVAQLSSDTLRAYGADAAFSKESTKG